MAEINANGTNAWYNEGVMLPKLLERIVETPIEGFDMRTLLTYEGITNNNIVTVPVEDGASTAVISRVAEGDSIPLNFEPIKGEKIVCYKIAEGFSVTREMVEMEQIAIIASRFRRLYWKFFHTINVDVITAVGAGVPAGNIIAATGTTIGQDGTVYTIVGAVGGYDLTNAKQVLREAFKATADGGVVLLANAEGARYLENIPSFTLMNQTGYAGVVNGLGGSLYGAQIIVSEDVPAGEMYLIGTNPLAHKTGQYTPIGYFVESRAFLMEDWKRPDQDGVCYYGTHIYGVGIVFGEGIAKITYAGYS